MATDYEAAFRTLSDAFDCMRLVLEGRCPKCGAVREDDDCRACGHHSTYVRPLIGAESEGG